MLEFGLLDLLGECFRVSYCCFLLYLNHRYFYTVLGDNVFSRFVILTNQNEAVIQSAFLTNQNEAVIQSAFPPSSYSRRIPSDFHKSDAHSLGPVDADPSIHLPFSARAFAQ